MPVVVCSAVTGTGVDHVADLVCGARPAARAHDGRIILGADRRRRRRSRAAVSPDPAGEALVHVFRTVADPFVGQVAMLKVLSGVVRPRDRLHNTTTGVEERMPALFRLRGAEHLHADALRAGEVGAVAKLTGSPAGSLLWSRPQGTARPVPLPTRAPVYAVSLEPASQSDDAKLSTALARLVAEDPTLVIDRAGGDTILRGLGDTHVAVAVERLARVLGVHVTTGRAPVAYRETIAKHGRGGGQAQEAVGRPRPVRRRAAARRAASARRRLRVRRLRRRRRCAPHLHPRRGEGRPRGARLRRAARATRSSTCGSSCSTASRTRSTPPRWPSAQPHRSGSRRRSPRRAPCCSNPSRW